MKNIDLGLDEREHLKYASNRDGSSTPYTDKRFHPAKDNFNKLVGSNNFTRFFLDHSEEIEWQHSERYKELVIKLYKEGLEEISRLERLKREITVENVKRALEDKLNDPNRVESLVIHYEERLKNVEKYTQELIEHYLGNYQCSLDYKIALYKAIFGKGIENFIALTKKYGHVINGVEFIRYTTNSFTGDEKYLECFHVEKGAYEEFYI